MKGFEETAKKLRMSNKNKKANDEKHQQIVPNNQDEEMDDDMDMSEDEEGEFCQVVSN